MDPDNFSKFTGDSSPKRMRTSCDEDDKLSDIKKLEAKLEAEEAEEAAELEASRAQYLLNLETKLEATRSRRRAASEAAPNSPVAQSSSFAAVASAPPPLPTIAELHSLTNKNSKNIEWACKTLDKLQQDSNSFMIDVTDFVKNQRLFHKRSADNRARNVNQGNGAGGPKSNRPNSNNTGNVGLSDNATFAQFQRWQESKDFH